MTGTAAAQTTEAPVAPAPTDPENILYLDLSTGGRVTVWLRPDVAPLMVERVKTLTRQKFYDGIAFHRVIEGFMAQGGDPKGDGTGGPGYAIRGEFSSNGVENDLSHVRGVLSMARSSANDSAGSQFFIMHETSPHLDGAYAAFGKITEGLDVIDKIATVPTDFRDRPLEDQVIATIVIDTLGETYPEPETV